MNLGVFSLIHSYVYTYKYLFICVVGLESVGIDNIFHVYVIDSRISSLHTKVHIPMHIHITYALDPEDPPTI